MPEDDVIGLLAGSCPTGSVRAARTSDSFEDLHPSVVAKPANTDEIARVLSLATRHDLAVTCRGAGTKLDWGGVARRADIVLDLSSLSGILEHNAGDLVVRVRAGTPLASLQGALSPKGQQLPLDEVVAGSTIGGVVATGISGPSRYEFGSVRDLLLGCSLVLSDGTSVRAGSKVVKNVAGYDLTKLIAGSFGTLGVLTEAIFRLRPLPQQRLYVSAEFEPGLDFAQALRSIVNSQIAPIAIELERTDTRGRILLTACVEGRREAVTSRAEAARQLLGDGHIDSAPPSGFGHLSGDVTLKTTCVISAVPEILESIASLAERHSIAPRVSGSAGVGVLFVGLGIVASMIALSEFVGELRRCCAEQGGSLVVLRAPVELRRAIDIFGEVPGLAIMERIKEEFDPAHLLSPGRFVGTI